MKKLFVLFLVYLLTPTAWALASPTSGARSQMCQDLFDTGELEKSIRGLAKLRMQLDVAKAHANGSLSFATLDSQYKEKEQSILGHALKNNLMSQVDFFKMISLEIAARQTDESKIETEKDQQSREIDDSILGRQVRFNEFKSNDLDLKTYEVMTTPTTEFIWRTIAELINSKLESKYHVPITSPETNGDFSPATNLSYNEIIKWIAGLNKLSKAGEIKLKDVIPDHQNGDTYKLPSEREWMMLFTKLYFDSEQLQNVISNADEDVSSKTPINVKNQEYYGLTISHFLDCKDLNKAILFAAPGYLWIKDRKEYEISISRTPVDSEYQHNLLSFRLIRRRAAP